MVVAANAKIEVFVFILVFLVSIKIILNIEPMFKVK